MNPGSTFRIRRVADWLGVDSYEDVAKTGGLVDNYSRLLTLTEYARRWEGDLFG
jgi:hypothetical protein